MGQKEKYQIPHNCHECDSTHKGIFCDLEKAWKDQLSDHKISNNYKKGQTLFVEGNPAFGVYCINRGHVKITKLDDAGKESIVRLATSGDIIGHRSLFTDEYYGATATALQDTTVCFLDKKIITKMVRECPSVAINLISRLGKDLGASEKKIASFSQKNVRERVAELLLLLKESYGYKENDTWRIDIKLTREEMASLVGTATETLIRFMSEFKDEKLISQQGKILYITDIPRLADFAGLVH